MHSRFSKVLVLSVVCLLTPLVNAKDLTSRLGVGPRNAFSFDLPSIAVNYYPNPEFGVTGALGIDTAEDNSRFGFQGGLRRIVFEENAMNFFMGGNLGIITFETAGVSESGYEVNALVGGEFFLPGLENLGFNFETGVGVVSMKSGTKFRTFADHPFRAGVIFYF